MKAQWRCIEGASLPKTLLHKALRLKQTAARLTERALWVWTLSYKSSVFIKESRQVQLASRNNNNWYYFPKYETFLGPEVFIKHHLIYQLHSVQCTPFSSLLESLWILATKSSNGNNFIFSHIISNISKVGQISANIVWSPTFIIVAFHLLLPCHGVDELLTR